MLFFHWDSERMNECSSIAHYKAQALWLAVNKPQAEPAMQAVPLIT